MPARDRSKALRIDTEAECLWRDGEKVGVPPKAFLLLRTLMERQGQLVTKRELLDAIWPDTFVSETVLTNAINQLRRALDDDPKQARFIETVHRRGYRWIGVAEGTRRESRGANVASASGETRGVATEPDISLLEPHASNQPSLFVGRAESLAVLASCYGRATQGQRQLVLVSGEPGIGKTSLVDRFLDGLDANPLVAHGQCIEAHGVGDLYRPVREVVEQMVRRGGDATRAVFRGLAPSWLLSMPDLLNAAELDALRRNVIAVTGESVQRELERAIEAASAGRPIVLVLEDLHWSDPATITLLWTLAARREPAQLMTIGTYRPADAIARNHPIIRLKHELTPKRQCFDLALDGLPIDAVAAFLDRYFTKHELTATFAACLSRQTTGNPLFLVNALADFERRGWLQEADGVWECTVSLETISAAIPESTRELIAFRFDQLPSATQAILEAASIVGVTFATQAVAAAAERSGDEIEAELEPMARAGLFLHRGDDIEWPNGERGSQYTFRHALYPQVLLRRITAARRQVLHRRVAAALENGYGDRAADIAGALSVHYEQAGEVFRAVDYIDILVRQASARSAVHEAAAMLAHAVALLKRLPSTSTQQERLLNMTIAYGLALSFLGGVTSDEGGRVSDDIRSLVQSMPSLPGHMEMLGGLVAVHIFRGELREAHRVAQEILARCRAEESPRHLIVAHSTLGTVLMHLGQMEAAVGHLERATAVIDATSAAAARHELSQYEPVLMAHMFYGWTLVLSGRSDRARRQIEAALQLASAMEMPWYLGFALSTAAAIAMVRRDRTATREFANAVLVYGEEKNLLNWRDMNRITLGWADVVESGDATRIAPLREVVDSFSTSGNASVFRMYAIFADACLSVGRIDEAATALDAAFDGRGEIRFYDAEIVRLRAMVQLARVQAAGSQDALVEVENGLEQAIEIANRQGIRLFELRATVDLCSLWRTTGKREQAHQRLTAAVARFDEGFDEPDLRAARALLGS